MTFILAKKDNLNSLVCSRANRVLSLFFDREPCCVLSSLDLDKEILVYNSIEQALDDFEYDTCKVSNKIIDSFKKVKNNFNTKRLLEMANKTDFVIEQEGDFVSLLYIPLEIQLNFSPSNETLTGESEFTITTLDFELVDNYETLGDNFTNDIEDALLYFEDIVGEIDNSTKENFINKCKE